MGKYAPVYMSVYDGYDYALSALTLSAATFADDAVEDDPIGTLSEMQSEDSTLSIIAGGDNVKLDGNDLVVGGTTPAAGTFNVTVRETNIYASNSPRDTTFGITVTEA